MILLHWRGGLIIGSMRLLHWRGGLIIGAGSIIGEVTIWVKDIVALKRWPTKAGSTNIRAQNGFK